MIANDFKLPAINTKNKKKSLKQFNNRNLHTAFSPLNKKEQEQPRKVISRCRSSKLSLMKKQAPSHNKRSSVLDSKTPAQTEQKTSEKKPPKKPSQDNLLYNIQKATSDLLELKRDLSTYEYNLLSQTSLSEKLKEIQVLSETMSQLDGKFLSMLDNNAVLVGSLLEGMKPIPMDSGEISQDEVFSEDYPTKEIVNYQYIQTLFQGSANISGEAFIVKIEAGKWLEKIVLTGKNSRGIHLNLVHKYTKESFSVEKFIEKVYISYSSKQGFVTKFSNAHGVNFLNLLCEIKRFGLCCVRIEESGQDTLSIKIEQNSLQVPTSNFKASIFDLSKAQLRRTISRHLFYHKELYWVTDFEENPIFKLKEDRSIFLKDEYVSEIMRNYDYTFEYSFNYPVLDAEVRVNVFKSPNGYYLKISYLDQTIELTSESKQMKFLVDLQDLKLSQQSLTLQKSLEFEAMIFKLFPSISNN